MGGRERWVGGENGNEEGGEMRREEGGERGRWERER